MKKMTEAEFNRIAKDFSATSLGEERKRDILARIYEAAPTGTASSPWNFSFTLAYRYAAASAIVLALAGGTAVTAAGSLPGDRLYGFKVKVMEPIALAARLDEGRQTAYKVSLLQKRIIELQKLKESGRVEFDSTYASYAATKQNVADIEENIAAVPAAETAKAAAYVETYNTLVDEGFELETTLVAEIEAVTTSSVEADLEIEADLPAASNIIRPAAATVGNTAQEAAAVVEAAAAVIEETVRPVENITAPILKGVPGL